MVDKFRLKCSYLCQASIFFKLEVVYIIDRQVPEMNSNYCMILKNCLPFKKEQVNMLLCMRINNMLCFFVQSIYTHRRACWQHNVHVLAC